MKESEQIMTELSFLGELSLQEQIKSMKVCVLTHRDVFGCSKYEINENGVKGGIETKNRRDSSQQRICHTYTHKIHYT